MSDKKELKKNYERYHRRFEKWRRGEETFTVRHYHWLLSLLGKPEGALLDVACGRGGFLAAARERGYRVTGVDISHQALKAARRQLPAGGWALSDAEALPLRDSGFRAVTCIGSLEHFPDPAVGARELRRVLAKGGRAVIYVPNLYFLGHIYLTWRSGAMPSEGGQSFSELFLTYGGWRDLLQEAGFKVLSCHKWNEVYGSGKVGRGASLLYRYVLKPFVPFNLSYSFAFVCTKQ